MKKTNLIKTALATILLCASLTACTSTEDKPYSVPESFTVTEKVTKAAENAYSKYDEAVCHPACVLGTKDSIKGTEFTPCYVVTDNNQSYKVEIEIGSGSGISSVGRMPIVMVNLVDDSTGRIYAAGYFKIQIIKSF